MATQYSNVVPAVAGIQGTAVTSNGNAAVATTTIVNTITGDKELMITFTNSNASGGASMNPKLKCGAWRGTIPANGGASAANVTDFASYEDSQAYFRLIQTLVVGVRATSTDPSNFNTGSLEFIEKQPDGNEKKVSRPLQRYLQPLGGGSYANEIVIPSEHLTILLWAGLEMNYLGLKPQSSITFFLTLRGWNKATTLTPLEAATI